MRASAVQVACTFVAAFGVVACAQLEHWEDVRISLSGPTEVEVGKRVSLVAETAHGIVERYRWRSDDETVATVDAAGRVTGRTAGKVTITAIGSKTKQEGSHRLTVNAAVGPGVPDAGPERDAGRDAGPDAGPRDAARPDGDDGGPDDDAGAPDAAIDATADTGIPAPSFAEVHSILLARCGACHAPGSPAAGTNYVLVDDLATDRETVLDLVDTVDPGESRLLAKARGDLAHGGGIVLARTSDDYTTLQTWIDAGAPP